MTYGTLGKDRGDTQGESREGRVLESNHDADDRRGSPIEAGSRETSEQKQSRRRKRAAIMGEIEEDGEGPQ